MANKILKTISVKWNWQGDMYMLKGFNIALMKNNANPVNGLSDVISYNSVDSHCYNPNNKKFEYTFSNITLDSGIKCTPWIQALFNNEDSEWVSLDGATIEDDGNATIVVIGNPTFQQVIDMSKDSKITPQEKLQLKKEWDEITSDHFSIYAGITKANLDSEVQEVKAYISAANELAKYLNNNKIYYWHQINDQEYTYPEMIVDGLTTDLNTGHYVNVDTYREKLRLYYESKVQVLNLIQDTLLANNNDLIQAEIDKNTLPSTIPLGGYTSCDFTKNKPTPGYIGISIGSFSTTTGHKFNITSPQTMTTNLTSNKYRTRFILFVGADYSRFQVTSNPANNSNMFITAIHKKGKWYYLDGANEEPKEFAPMPEDCVVAKVEEYDSTKQQNGIESIKFYASTSQSVFNALTDGGKLQGMFKDEDGRLFINAEFIQANSITADKMNIKGIKVVNSETGETTFEVTPNGEIHICANKFVLTAGSTTNVPTKDQVKDDINGIKIGGRNYITNSAFKKGLEGFTISNPNEPGTIEFVEFQGRPCIKFTDIGCWDVSKFLRTSAFLFPGNEYMSFSMDVYITKGTKFYIDPDGVLDQGDFPIEVPRNNEWLRIGGTTIKRSRTSGNITIAIYADRSSETISGYLTLLKAETGTKPGGWSEAPEDTDAAINSKVPVGGSINDINQSPNGQIAYPKLNIRGAISFDDLASEIGQNFIAKTDSEGNRIQTVINGKAIETNSVTADKMTMYNLNVVRRKMVNGKWQDIDTSFSITDEGRIRASGTFSSFNFKNDIDVAKSEGWMISEDGDSVFNNSLIRGRVELPNAGMTNYGGGSNYNLLLNGDIRDITVNNNVGWDNEKNGNLTINIWGGYNSGVDKSNEGYHAHCNNKTFSFNVVEFNNNNSEIGIPNRWLGIYQTIPINRYKFKSNFKYTFSIDVYFTKIGEKIYGGLYHKTNGKDDLDFSSGQFEFIAKSVDELNKWQRLSWTFTTNKNINTDFPPSWYIYGYRGEEGVKYITKIKLEEGETDTGYTSNAEVAKKEVRIYAGADYYNRYNAPFRVLQDGSIIATKGEFNGTVTGRLEIGNISIYDDLTTPGVIEIKNNDNSKTIVRIGEEYSEFNSDVFIGPKTNYMFRTNLANKQLVSGKESSIRFEYEKTDEYGDTFANSITIDGRRILFNKQDFISSPGTNRLEIGTEAPKGTLLIRSRHNSEIDGILGEMNVNIVGSLTMNQSLTVGNVEFVPKYPGLDIFVN